MIFGRCIFANLQVGIDNYIDEGAKGIERGEDENIGSFKIGNNRYDNVMGYASIPKEMIQFYPYIEMEYDTMESKGKKVKILAEGLSEIKNSEYVEIGWRKSEAITLKLDSNQWSTHFRATKAVGKNNALPGGSIYTINQGESKVKVGIRVWQTLIGEEEIGGIVGGEEYYKREKVKERRERLIEGIKGNLERLEIVQYIVEGKTEKIGEIEGKGIELKSKEGESERVYGQNTSKDSKYYLKRGTNREGIHKVDDSNLDILGEERVRETEYRIKSDTEGRVEILKNGKKIKEIGKEEGIEEIKRGNEELEELDRKTKLITNYMKVIDRNKGNNGGERWYNEGNDGIRVIVSEYEIEVGIGEVRSRRAAIDPRLIGGIVNKGDIYNENKYRSSIFMTSKRIEGKEEKGEGYIGTWGEDKREIRIKEIGKMFMSKVFYIPNATVGDLN